MAGSDDEEDEPKESRLTSKARRKLQK